MEEFLGYDDLLLGSIKHLAVSESVKGHMANVVSGQHYRLVSAQMSRSSYLVATLVMLLLSAYLCSYGTQVTNWFSLSVRFSVFV
ncbi:hypothetical protein X801_07040 [Opisthorchis viverrini]|uniref:Uncharacterized protein n=1 Tax=Opisthorchis viverrini TaxID=6198 RepID=A0A1S8WRQ6_OPIVI|nr:hypothetical protein X801_07040 [Opisthorchis viverrini]